MGRRADARDKILAMWPQYEALNAADPGEYPWQVERVAYFCQVSRTHFYGTDPDVSRIARLIRSRARNRPDEEEQSDSRRPGDAPTFEELREAAGRLTSLKFSDHEIERRINQSVEEIRWAISQFLSHTKRGEHAERSPRIMYDLDQMIHRLHKLAEGLRPLVTEQRRRLADDVDDPNVT